MTTVYLGRKNIGTLDRKKKTYRKVVRKSKHLFRALDAWGIDAAFFNDVLLPENYTIRVYDKDEKTTYEITADGFRANSQYFHFKNEDTDHYTQVFCPLRNWRTTSLRKKYGYESGGKEGEKTPIVAEVVFNPQGRIKNKEQGLLF